MLSHQFVLRTGSLWPLGAVVNSQIVEAQVQWALVIYFEERYMLRTIVLIILILMLVGAVPVWPHSMSWGYGPSGGLGLVLITIVVLMILGII